MKKNKKIFIIFILFISFLSFLGITMMKNPSKNVVLRTREIYDLIKDVDPSKILFTPQYYFLENTSLPLVVDNYTQDTGFEPALVERWYRPDPKTWKFVLKKNLRFSDGTPITSRYIFEELKRIQDKKPRSLHLNFIYLAKMKFITKENAIYFKFPFPVQDEFLFELSLADLSILHPKNKKKDWSVTSGAYFVEKTGKKDGVSVMYLHKNPHFPLKRPKMIKRVEIYDLSKDQLIKNFKRFRLNFISSYYWKEKRFFRKHADKTWIGFPVISYFFSFCPLSSLSKNETARKVFAHLVYQSIPFFKDKNFRPDFQVLPKGHPGRSYHYVPPVPEKKDFKLLKGKTFTIYTNHVLEKNNIFFKKLKMFAKKYQIQMNFIFDSITKYPKKESSNAFAYMYSFVSNQKDPLSIWSFLLRSNIGIACFKKKLNPLFQKALKKHSRQVRWYHLGKLHEYVLKHFMLVPFGMEGLEYYTSSNLSLDAFNPFDMKPRYYEVVVRNTFPFF